MAATKRRRTKGAGGVFRDKAGKWHFRTEITADPGTGRRRIIETTGLVKSDARQRHENKLREYERTGIIHSNQSPYLRDYIIRWCGQRRRDLKPNTWYNLDKRCNIIANIIGGVRLAELTPAHVRLMMDRLGRTRAPRTVREYHGILKQALDDAELEELIDRNPCRRVRPPRYEETPQRILDESQPKELIAAAVKAPMAGGRRGPHDSPEDTEMWAILFELAFATGMREGERYALMPYELEIRDGIPGIFVQQQLQDYVGGADAVIPKWHNAVHWSADSGSYHQNPRKAYASCPSHGTCGTGCGTASSCSACTPTSSSSTTSSADPYDRNRKTDAGETPSKQPASHTSKSTPPATGQPPESPNQEPAKTNAWPYSATPTSK